MANYEYGISNGIVHVTADEVTPGVKTVDLHFDKGLTL